MTITWEQRKEQYNKDYLERQGGYQNHNDLQSRVCEELIELFNPRRVIDCGCAEGWLVHQFLNRGVDCYGIEVNEHAVKHGSIKFPNTLGKLFCFDMAVSPLPFADGYFDLVVAREFIEHIDDDHLFFVIKEMTRVASEWLFFETPMIVAAPQGDFKAWIDWLRELNDTPLLQARRLVGKDAHLVKALPTPDDLEHPNRHAREYWLQLFDLIGFDRVEFAEKHYQPLRYDGICGLNILHLRRRV